MKKFVNQFALWTFFAIIFSAMSIIGEASAQAAPVPAVDQVLVQWDYSVADEANITNFTIEQKTQACSGALGFVETATPLKSVRFFLDTGLTRGATYCYRVFAVGVGINGKSAASNTIERTIAAPPVAPSNVR